MSTNGLHGCPTHMAPGEHGYPCQFIRGGGERHPDLPRSRKMNEETRCSNRPSACAGCPALTATEFHDYRLNRHGRSSGMQPALSGMVRYVPGPSARRRPEAAPRASTCKGAWCAGTRQHCRAVVEERRGRTGRRARTPKRERPADCCFRGRSGIHRSRALAADQCEHVIPSRRRAIDVRRRHLLGGLTGTAIAGPSLAQNSIRRSPIRLVVGYTLGGGNDLIAHIVAAQLQETRLPNGAGRQQTRARNRSSQPSWSPRHRPTATRCWSRRAGR